MKDNLGASVPDRAGGPSDLSRSASQPEALIPCAAWWRCLHCGHDRYIPRVFIGELKGMEFVDCAACGIMHSPPDPNGPRALRWHVQQLTEALENLAIDVEMGWGDPHTLADAKAALYAAQAIEARKGQDREAGLDRNDESAVTK